MASIASSNLSKRTYKIVLLGSSGVGKTSLINRFAHGKFDDQANPTVGIDFVGKNVTHEGVAHRLQLWDTAGQERYRSLIPTYLKDALCCIFVYDSTNGDTLESIEAWIKLFKESKADKSFLIICGNKIDLLASVEPMKKGPTVASNVQSPKLEEEPELGQPTSNDCEPVSKSFKQIKPETLSFLLKKYQMKHFEVSAATGENVAEMFHAIINEIAQEQQKKKKKLNDFDLPFSSTNLMQRTMEGDHGDLSDSIRMSEEPLEPIGPGKKRRKKKLSRMDVDAEGEESGEKTGLLGRWCRCCVR